jgi:hypothetical protein
VTLTSVVEFENKMDLETMAFTEADRERREEREKSKIVHETIMDERR